MTFNKVKFTKLMIRQQIQATDLFAPLKIYDDSSDKINQHHKEHLKAL